MSRLILAKVVIPKANQVFSQLIKPTTFNNFQLTRSISSKTISPSVTFITNGSTRDIRSRPDLSNFSNEGRPLTILVCWLMSKDSAVKKYTEFYLERGYDVLEIRVTPWNILLPSSIDPIIQKEILPALISSNHEKKLLHAFSIGGFLFGRILKQMENDSSCDELKKSVKGQIWDSVTDLSGFSKGISKSIFLKNQWLQEGFQNYLNWHLKVFYNVATKYYEEGKDYYYFKPLVAPALFFTSEVDPISTMDVFENIRKSWVSKGINCSSKIWNDSGHVGHMKKHPEEYKLAVINFLKSIGLRTSPVIVPERIYPTRIPVGTPYVVYSKAV